MMKNKIVHLTVFLLLVTGISGLAIGYVNGVTAPVIAAQDAQKLKEGYAEVYPDADDYKESTYTGTEKAITGLVTAVKGGEEAGVLYVVDASGYGGTVQILVGFDIAGKTVTGIKVLNQSETPGLGANCANAWFAQRYIGKSAEKDLTVVKVETADPGEVQAITAATITSQGVTDGVNIARRDFAANYGSL
ncbi:MAG: RnfABCDGE type electron transport complex subunit G [Peptococcaceae bacterium]|nr:RnfABCDGE type electron transport complex subunit G [Peptococcaceae bacterium]